MRNETDFRFLMLIEAAINQAGCCGLATAEPFGADEIVSEAALFQCRGPETRVEAGDEGVVNGATFGANDLGFGVDAGLEWVLRRNGAIGGRAGRVQLRALIRAVAMGLVSDWKLPCGWNGNQG
jgi:hypothetical protein